jgi:hypothetical protein
MSILIGVIAARSWAGYAAHSRYDRGREQQGMALLAKHNLRERKIDNARWAGYPLARFAAVFASSRPGHGSLARYRAAVVGAP